MAFAPLTELVVGECLMVVGDALVKEANVVSVREDVTWIENELLLMRCFLEEADAKKILDEKLRNRVREIRELCFEAEDVVDTFNESQQQLVPDLVGLRWISRAIRRIKSRISRFPLTHTSRAIAGGLAQSHGHSSRATQLQVEESDSESESESSSTSLVVGLRQDLEMMLPRLIQGEQRRCVISIVGMGGSGKTALAKMVYNCKQVQNHFPRRAFVRLSQQSRIRKILIFILMRILDYSITEMGNLSRMGIPSDKDLGENLFSELSRERYLVVIDDIQSMEAWDALNALLPDCSSHGSRVLLTTRNRDIASISDRIHPHEARLLDDGESWELLFKKVFPPGYSFASPLWLEVMKKRIFSECGGLPAGIVELGGLLSKRETTSSAWSKVLDNEAWRLTDGSSLQVLASNYYDLPHYLKECFLYLGLFPQHSEILSKKLIKLWIAEGFIQERGKEGVEDVAEDCLNELISKCMIQVVRNRHDGFPKTCRIHNLLREIIISQAKECNFFEIEGNTKPISSSTPVRRLAIHQSTDQHGSHGTRFLRSILCFPKCGLHLSRLLNRGVNFLKVLDLEGVHIQGKTLPTEIGRAIRLRYLNLRNTGIETLPSSLGKLVKLEALDLRDNHINPVPHVILGLKQLRVLHLDTDTTSMDGDSLDVSSLTRLRTLTIRAGRWMKHGLLKLTDLRNLRIYGDLDLCRNDLPQLSSLEFLRVGFGFGDGIPNQALNLCNTNLCRLDLKRRLFGLPDQDHFPPNLTSLFLKWSQLKQDPMEVLGKLPNLQVLRLGCSSFLGKNMACSATAFPNLQLLELNLLNGLEEWRIEEGALPKLRRLVICLCKRLKMLPPAMQHLTNLEELEVAGMTDVLKIRLKQNVGEDWNAIKHVRSVTVDGIQMSGASSSLVADS